eukprot:TRINITY_DN5746_c0_g1_i5.p1 TRINITY_DN5746_c0_g1~~TRINITY_DN5746_c0_g1_i5.p1  ORF type:complete len:470 (-),score=38.24 TRINITY_DN5746_c0_g1_i5:26-1435(-)
MRSFDTVLSILLTICAVSNASQKGRKLSQDAECNYDFVDQLYCGDVPWFQGQNLLISNEVSYTDSSDYPFLVSLQLDRQEEEGCYEHFCAGTMIAPNLVLSAAHCFQELVGGKSLWPSKIIWVSFYPQCRHQGNSEYGRIAVDQIFMHPQYRSSTKEADVAILSLQGYYLGGQIKLDLSNTTSARDSVEVVGYGYVRPSDKGFYKVYPLRKANFDVATPESCNFLLNATGIEDGIFNNTGMMCAIAPGTDTCDGDSGGPVMVVGKDGKRAQVAVISWGAGVQCEEIVNTLTPTVFTRISAFKDWICDIIQNFGLDGGPNNDLSVFSCYLPTTPSPTPQVLSPELSQKDAIEAFKYATGYSETVCRNWTKERCYEIVLYNADLSGTLVLELSVLTDLKRFDMWNNSFQGTLAPEFSLWIHAEYVDFAKNKLSGTLPPTYSTWVDLDYIRFNDNKFEEKIQQEKSKPNKER